MKVRELGSRELLLYKCSTNFLISFQVNNKCNIKQFINSCNFALANIEIFKCYCKEDGIYKLNTPPSIKLSCQEFDILIKELLSKNYKSEEYWVDAIYHIPTNTLNICIEHTIGDVPTVINFIKQAIANYKNHKEVFKQVRPPLEKIIDVEKLPILNEYGENKGENKSFLTLTIKKDTHKLTTQKILEKIQSSYLYIFKTNQLKFDLTIDLRNFFKNLYDYGYYCHIQDFAVEKGKENKFYSDLKYTLTHIDKAKHALSFEKFFNPTVKHQIACTSMSNSSLKNIDNNIIVDIFPYSNAFYFRQNNITSFIIYSVFNNTLNMSFCYDVRDISHNKAKEFVSYLYNSLRRI